MQGPPTKPKSRVLVIVLVVLGLAAFVPCVVGVLAAVAIPSFIGYVRRSKTAEALANLRELASAEQSWCNDHGTYLVPGGPVPAFTPGGVKAVGDFAADPTFHALGFDPGTPVYYSYSVADVSPGEIAITARGDLDGDGAESAFVLHCGGSCTCDAEPVITDELE
jgi:type II secretory pathway pseudopilin PulG